MKKQILILTFFVAAFLVATTSVFAQTGDGDPTDYQNYIVLPTSGSLYCTDAVQLSCADSADALHPLPGVEYTYTVDITDDAGTPERVLWFVTDTTAIMDSLNNLTLNRDPNPGEYVLTATSGVYNADANTSNTITMSWQSFDGTSQTVLLVVYVEGADGCTDNIEVYKIEPVFNFTLDLASLDAAGQLNTDSADCVSPIQSAVYNASTEVLTVDYGENWAFFTVNAANFSHSWLPEFRLSYTGSVDEDVEVQWAYPAGAVSSSDADWHTTTLTSGTNLTDLVFTSADSVAAIKNTTTHVADAAGECIYVRVRIDHGVDNEIDADDGSETLTFAVNGTMYDAVDGDYLNEDLDDLGEDTDSANGTACDAVDFDDQMNYTITTRPAVNEVAPDPFEEKTGDQ